MGIEGNLQRTQARINEYAERADRNPDDIKLVAVSKTISLDIIIEAVHAGVQILGENRVQEARDKIADFKLHIPSPPTSRLRGKAQDSIEWHLIGNLQKNKSKTAVQLFDLIHSVDSIALAQELDKYASIAGKIQRVLVQVKLSDEVTKHGVPEKDLMDLLDKVSAMGNIKLEGLMTVPPFFDDLERTRPYFRKMREIAERAMAKGYPVKDLSMGMSMDFRIAIEEGSTMVRVGTAIFGERDYT
jgi:pyridoxal phosphate enzyme (YggS family)